MAANKTKDKGERVEVKIPRASAKDEADLFVSVNGVNYIIPKNKTVLVPKAVAREIERSQRARERFFETQDRLTSKPE